MRVQKTVLVSLKAIKANKIRSILTSLGVIIGVSSVILLVSIGSGIQEFVNEQFEQMGSNTLTILPGKFLENGPGAPSFAQSKLSEKEVAAVSKIKSISEATGGFQTFATLKRGGDKVYGELNCVKSKFSRIFDINLDQGDFFNWAQEQSAEPVVVIGDTFAQELFENKSAIGREITLDNKKYTVVGVLEKTGSLGFADADAVAYIPLSTAKLQYNFDNYSYIMAKFKEGSEAKRVQREVKQALLVSLEDDDFTIMSQDEILRTVSTVISTITAALGGIAAVSLLVGGIGIMNIMLVSVTERTKEIGIRKAVGAKPRDILIQFLVEALVLSALGGVIGIGLGILGSRFLDRFFVTHVTAWSIGLSFSFATLTGIIFGIAPAIKASRQDPIEALRYE